jgi:hypothetical protein
MDLPRSGEQKHNHERHQKDARQCQTVREVHNQLCTIFKLAQILPEEPGIDATKVNFGHSADRRFSDYD